ncbi:P-loop containing nucleoside triphosphate hydrolase protein, partial [Mycena latifolia]
AAIDTNLQVYKGFSTGTDSTPTKVPQHINNCPPPTRIFHGRKTILDKMHQFFTQSLDKQCIFLLHGLGGGGKTQTALKFVEQSVSQFTDIFVIDTSTVETIDAGLKMIATTKSVGDSSKDALQWLRSKQDEWLLFFDNADDPKINLNNYFPQCSHGNIIITSRNPGLCVYAGSHCAVSDMEEKDAVDLLLTSAAQDITDYNKDIAAQIVKVLHYLPLAIIQAGAFISKSGNLGSYLALYEHNKARLLTEQPVQSHDNYAWTVYTTWQISFEQLSEQAKTFLKLCSFLHYHGISENIFKNAMIYVFKPSSLSKEELEMPVKVLSQFSDPSGAWDPLRFMDVTNEIRAYSLINFDLEKNMFSIHPLVHDWTRSTLSDETCHQCMVAITGISLRGKSEHDIHLASPWMLPHIDFLIQHNPNAIQDFRHDYGKVYSCAGKPKKAEELGLAVLEQRNKLLGEDHPDTLDSMHWLAWTYQQLGKLNEAEKLWVSVWEKRRENLGDNHPDTLDAMGGLASTCRKLGKLKEAEKLEVLVLQKRRNILGDNHLQTLTAMGNLAATYFELGRPREAEGLQLIVLDKRRNILGNKHPGTLLALGNLANTYNLMGQLQDAEVLQLEILEKRRDVLGDKHPETLRTMSNLAYTYHIQGKLREAEQLGLVTFEDRRNILGDDHPDTLISQGILAVTYKKLGRLQEAEQLELVVLQKRRLILGDNHFATLRAMSSLGYTLNKLERWKEAEELLVVALEKQRGLLSAGHFHLVDTMQNLAETFT